MPEEKVQDSVADSSTATDQVAAVVEDDFTPPADLKDEKSKERFQKLVDRAKAAETALGGYKELGDPEQLAELVTYTRQLETAYEQTQARIKALEDKREPGEAKTEEQKKLEASSGEIRKQLRQHEPLLDEMERFLKEQKEEKAARIQALTLDAVEATQDVMKQYGLPVTREKVQEMCDTLEPIIRKDPRLRFRFERNPEQAIKGAMEKYFENARVAIEGRTRLESQRTKEKNAVLPRSHGGGGGPGPGKTQEPVKSISQGITRAMGKWRESQGA